MNLAGHSQIVRFGLVGVFNTAVDIGIFHALANILEVNFVLANIISTSIALMISYVLHARFTFKSKTGTKSGVLFVGITLAGLWVLQPIVIALVPPLAGMFINQSWALLLGKLLATVVSLVWNFLLYKFVVFKPDAKK